MGDIIFKSVQLLRKKRNKTTWQWRQGLGDNPPSPRAPEAARCHVTWWTRARCTFTVSARAGLPPLELNLCPQKLLSPSQWHFSISFSSYSHGLLPVTSRRMTLFSSCPTLPTPALHQSVLHRFLSLVHYCISARSGSMLTIAVFG